MTQQFSFTLHATDGKARTGEISMPRGIIRTPVFMPVGTAGTVKGMYLDQVRALGADIILGNTYHLMLRPGAERMEELGGLHEFARWPHPILTDSGGFQVMSLASLRKLDEDGVTFRSHIDGSAHRLTPERSVEIQLKLDSDIIMQFDECIRLPAEEKDVERAMRLSLRWAERCKVAFGTQPGKALFGIVQGGTSEQLRRESAEALAALDLPGYALGGLAVGEPQAEMLATIEATEPYLPRHKPRYLMGVGTPDDILEAIGRGIDMFDCVMPTRNGRNALVFTDAGPIRLRNASHERDRQPLEADCPCPACQHSRGYLRHLFQAGEMLGPILASIHNLTYYQRLMTRAREAIAADAFDEFRKERMRGWNEAC